jgi:hypothetical protein
MNALAASHGPKVGSKELIDNAIGAAIPGSTDSLKIRIFVDVNANAPPEVRPKQLLQCTLYEYRNKAHAAPISQHAPSRI